MSLKDAFDSGDGAPTGLMSMLTTCQLLVKDKAEADKNDDRMGNRRQSMPEYLCDWFFHRFGLKTVADTNLGRFAASMLKHKEHPCIRLFIRMSGIAREEPGLSYFDPVEQALALRTLRAARSTDVGCYNGLAKLRKKNSTEPYKISVYFAWQHVREHMLAFPFIQNKWVIDNISSKTAWFDLADEDNLASNALRVIELNGEHSKKVAKNSKINHQVKVLKKRPATKAAIITQDFDRIKHLACDLFTFLEVFAELNVRARDQQMRIAVDHVEEIFVEADKNGDGMLTFEEFDAIMGGCTSRRIDKRRMHKLFKFSKNGDGKITRDSFVAMMKENDLIDDLHDFIHRDRFESVDETIYDSENEVPAEEQERLEREESQRRESLSAEYEIIASNWKAVKDFVLENIQSSLPSANGNIMEKLSEFHNLLDGRQPESVGHCWELFRTLVDTAKQQFEAASRAASLSPINSRRTSVESLLGNSSSGRGALLKGQF